MRKIYRLLEPGEYVQSGDEYFGESGSWKPIDYLGSLSKYQLPHRRRETIEDEPSWVSVKERKPTIDDACGDAVAVIWEYDGSLTIAHWRSVEPDLYSYWLKVPKSPKSDSFETFWQTNKEKLIDVSKEAARLIYEKARA